MEKERKKANILSQIQQEEQKKREMKSAIKIQSVVRMFRWDFHIDILFLMNL